MSERSHTYIYEIHQCAGDYGEQTSCGIIFPLDPVFSGAVNIPFSFLHESLLHVEKKVSIVQCPMPEMKPCPPDIEFGSFSSSTKCEKPCDESIISVGTTSHYDGVTNLQRRVRVSEVNIQLMQANKWQLN